MVDFFFGHPKGGPFKEGVRLAAPPFGLPEGEAQKRGPLTRLLSWKGPSLAAPTQAGAIFHESIRFPARLVRSLLDRER